ncbi:MAG: ATP-binding cassette domain-containing protein [Mariprofundus sp.]
MNKPLHQLNIGDQLHARSGDIILLTGSNGCGKTLWLERLAGLKAVPAGVQININSKAVTKYTVRMLGEQWPPIWLGQTIREELAFGLKDSPGPEAIDSALLHWGLSALEAETATARLNRLQAVRLCLSGISMANPALVLLDNPTDALPETDAAALITEIATWAGESKSIVVVACNRWQDWRSIATQHWQLTSPDSLPWL